MRIQIAGNFLLSYIFVFSCVLLGLVCFCVCGSRSHTFNILFSSSALVISQDLFTFVTSHFDFIDVGQRDVRKYTQLLIARHV